MNIELDSVLKEVGTLYLQVRQLTEENAKLKKELSAANSSGNQTNS